MKNWFEWIIPVVVVTVAILNAILRNREKEEPVRKSRAKSGDGSEKRRPASDIDRFLQEIDRLRKQPVDENTAAAKPNRAPIPRVKPVGTQPPRVRPAPTRVTARPVEVIQAVIERKVEAIPLAPPAAAPAPRRVVRRSNPAFEQAMTLLGSPKSAATAVILHEILGPPKCRRSN